MKEKFWKKMKRAAVFACATVGLMGIFQVSAYADTLTLCIEKSTIGQGMILDPVQVEFTSGETTADVLIRAAAEHGVSLQYTESSSFGWYLEGIKNVDSGYVSLPSCIQDILANATDWEGKPYVLESSNKYAPDLTEFSYISSSGWTYKLDDTYMNVGMGNSESKPSDGSVVRVMFTVTGGTDITGYDPSTQKTYFTAANKDDLIRAMGVANAGRTSWSSVAGMDSAYAYALSVLTKVDATLNDVYEATLLLQDVNALLPKTVESINLSSGSLNFYPGDAPVQLNYTISPSDAAADVIWSSSNNSVVTVNAGLVTPVGVGTASVKATASNGVSASCTVTVSEKPIVAEGVKLTPDSCSFQTGDSARQLEYVLSPQGAKAKSLVWKSDNDKVASVDASGKVTPVTLGETDIRLTVDGKFSAACHVVVGADLKSNFEAGKPVLKSSQVTASTASITWKKYPYAKKYRILRRKEGERTYKQIAETTACTYKDSAVTAASVYYYGVQAVSSTWGTSIQSQYEKNFSVTTAKAAIKKPGKPSLTVKAGKKQAVLAWKKVSLASGYQVYRASSKNGKYSLVTTIKKGNTVFYTNKKLKTGKTYYYKVRAYRTVSGKKVYGAYSSVKAVKIK